MIAIVAAMKDEVARLGGLSRRSKGRAHVTVTGVGKDKVVATMETLLQGKPYPSLVLSLGFAGALSDDLNTGDLILARNLYLVESDGVLEVDNRYYQLAERAINENVLPYVRRDTLTVPNIVRTQAERERLAQTYSAQAVVRCSLHAKHLYRENILVLRVDRDGRISHIDGAGFVIVPATIARDSRSTEVIGYKRPRTARKWRGLNRGRSQS